MMLPLWLQGAIKNHTVDLISTIIFAVTPSLLLSTSQYYNPDLLVNAYIIFETFQINMLPSVSAISKLI